MAIGRNEGSGAENNRMKDPEPSMPAEAEPAPTGSAIQPANQSPNEQTPGLNGHAPANGREGAWLSRLFGLGRRDANRIREDLTDALSADGDKTEAFTPEEKAMLHNVLRMQDVRVEDVMVPRAEMEAVEIGTSLGELMRMFEVLGHSRMPVYEETLDDPRGMVHIRDVMAYITRTAELSKAAAARRKNPLPADLDLKRVSLAKPLSALKLVRDVLFVPPSMLASDLMARMQATRTQMALVIDEYGGTDGLVSLEDLVEVIVGDIEDEHDIPEEGLVVEKAAGVYVCDARAPLDEIAQMIGDDFQVGGLGEEVDTIGGLVFALIGRVPVRGEVIEALGFEFRVIDADPRRIRFIELTRSRRRRQRAAPAR